MIFHEIYEKRNQFIAKISGLLIDFINQSMNFIKADDPLNIIVRYF
jgi:hypothetical protein